jgi:hypothetical protein
MSLTITGTLTIGATTTFGGTIGFTTANYNQIVAGTTVTLKSGVTYTVTGQLTITGTVASRCVLRSDTPISVTGSVTPPTQALAVTTSTTIPAAVGGCSWIMSQNPANNAILRKPVLGMNNTSSISTIAGFPVVTPATSSLSFILSKSFGMSQRGVLIGLSAKFNHSGTQSVRNLNYVNTFDIDSSGSSSTILANNSYQNKVGIPSPNLWRTVNWDSLNPLLPNISVAYIE